MNRYPVHIKYHNDVITRKTTFDTLATPRDVRSFVIQAFNNKLSSSDKFILCWCQWNQNGPLNLLNDQNDYNDWANWHVKHYQSFLNVYDSMNDIVMVDKEEWLNYINNLQNLLNPGEE